MRTFAPGHLHFRQIIENWQKMPDILEMLFCQSDDLRQIQFPSVIFIAPSDKVTFVLHVFNKEWKQQDQVNNANSAFILNNSLISRGFQSGSICIGGLGGPGGQGGQGGQKVRWRKVEMSCL